DPAVEHGTEGERSKYGAVVAGGFDGRRGGTQREGARHRTPGGGLLEPPLRLGEGEVARCGSGAPGRRSAEPEDGATLRVEGNVGPAQRLHEGTLGGVEHFLQRAEAEGYLPEAFHHAGAG